MSEEIHLERVPKLAQADFLHQLVPALWQRPGVLAIWLEGSLSRGQADRYSDVDLYVGVTDAALDDWRELAVAQLFGEHYAAHSLSNFGQDFFVYHVYLTAGGIYDLHIQPQSRPLPKAQRLLLAGRLAEYEAALLAARPDEDGALLFAPQPVDPTILPELIVRFWINIDKGRKVLYRHQDFTSYAGLNLFRHWLARLLFIEQTDTDCGDLAAQTIHRLKAASMTLTPTLATGLGDIMGAVATNRLELWQTQAQLHTEVARVGRVLADRYHFDYPAALEQIVRQNWQNFKRDELIQATTNSEKMVTTQA